MLVAENEKKERCFISKLTMKEIENIKKSKWFCPGCKSQLIIKNGQVMRPHFAHKNKKECASFSENESEEHLKGKELIAVNCEKSNIDYELEAFLPKLNQRPDILINNKIAIEFQCSPLSIERFKERSENYLNNGYQVVWILGKRFHLNNKLSSLQKQFIYYSNQVGFYLWELDVDKEEIRLDYFILLISSKLHFERNNFILSQMNVVEILECSEKILEIKKITNPSVNYYEQQCRWNRELNFKQQKAMTLQSFFYKKNQSLININEIYFLPSFLTPLLMEEELILRYLVYEYFLMFQEGDIKNIIDFITNEYQFLSYPLVEDKTLIGYCLSLYLVFLMEQKIIDIDNNLMYSLKNKKPSKEIKIEILWLPLKYGMISK